MNEDAKKTLAEFMAARTPDTERRAAAWEAIDSRIASGDMGPPLPDDASAGAGAGGLLAKIGAGGLVLAAVAYWAWPESPESPDASRAAPAVHVEPEKAPLMPSPPAAAPPEVAAKVGPPARPEDVAEPVVEPPAKSKRPKERERVTTEPTQAPPAGPSDLAEEMRLLRKGQAALASGRHQQALNAFDEHASRFPNGVMRDERRVRRAEALCALGRSEDARRAAQSFVRDAPGSPLVGKARRICEDAK